MNGSGPSRRDFLGRSAGIVTAGGVVPYWLTNSGAAAEQGSKNDRPNVGAIGVGGRGSEIAGYAGRHGDVVAVCDVHLARARKAWAVVSGDKAAVYQDHHKLLDRKDIDVVTIGTTEHWHSKIAIEAMQAGKDVYCEKPLTFSIDEGKQICQVVKQTGRVFQVGIPYVDTTDGAAKLPGMSDREQIGIIKYHLAQCVPVAENYNVTINVEPHGPFTTNPEMLLEIIDHFDSPHVKINFDTGNSFISGQDPVTFLEQVIQYVTHLPLKDVSQELTAAARGKDTGIASSSVYVGQGANAENISECIQLLKKHNWDGVLSIEVDGDQNVQSSIEWLRGQLDQ